MSIKVGALLEQFMLGAGVDDTRLSQATKVAKANISRLRNDPKANPTLATLKPLAAFFGVTVSQLLGEAPIGVMDEVAQVACRLPILAWHDIQNNLDGQYYGVSDWLSVEEKLTEHSFAVIMSDKTMVPIFPLGSLLIIESQIEYVDGMHVLLKGMDGGDPFLRQYLVDGNVRLLKSLKIGANWVEALNSEMQIIGAVIEIRYKMEGVKW